MSHISVWVENTTFFCFVMMSFAGLCLFSHCWDFLVLFVELSLLVCVQLPSRGVRFTLTKVVNAVLATSL